ncbi:MAG: hypothetical protein JOZ00_26340 [Mycobacterium sp.]|uniref:hypothetical protein n=1 Tax=Mycobacterium sp. TaxID=1785 RepID=UPI001ECF730A|nr:hypothetical protein [Mycobacterium sp.]MBV8790187.1 hypothetical protein [Mycobacterium sp.]
MRVVLGVTVRMLGGVTVAAASVIPGPAPQAAAQPPPNFPSLDGYTAVPADGYASAAAGSPRLSFAGPYGLVCDFYGGPAPAPQPSQDIKCKGDLPGLDDLPFPGGGRSRPGDCVVGSVDFKGPGYQLSRMSYFGCDGNPASAPSGAKVLNAGQKLSYLNVTCAVGNDNLVACLDSTSGDHGFVLQRSGSWAF